MVGFCGGSKEFTKQIHKLQRIKNNTNSGQITGIQEKMDTTCKYNT